MAGFKTDILKATILAVGSVLLLGVATYFISPLSITAPETKLSIDAYTEKGGLGLGIGSNFYVRNENVSIFATVKDSSDNPIANATVTFEINGPPGSNITMPKSAETNSSGVAAVTVTLPHSDAIEGVWTAIVSTEISGTQALDSLAFELKPPPSPFVDVYTAKGGKGPNNSTMPYVRDEEVILFAEVNNGTNPVRNGQVTFAAYGPTNDILFFTTTESNSSGVATAAAFRIPVTTESIGTWRIIVTVRVNDNVLIDALTFECET